MPLSSDTWEGDESNLASPETGLSLNLKSIHFGDVWKYRGVTVYQSVA
jgi:hypothetical protein